MMVAAGMAGDEKQRATGTGGHGGLAGGLARDPRVLAATAAGLASAVLALWAFRGLPLGSMLLWLSPLPLFLAGLGFGLGSLAVSVAVAVLALLLAGNLVSLGIWLVGTGLPVAALLLAGLRGRGRRPELAWPLALLGLYPAAVILLAAMLLGQEPGGLEGVMRQAVELGLDRMGLDLGDAVVAELVRVKAAAISFWISIALIANAAAARGLLERLGLGDPLRGGSAFAAARLPRLYPALPAAAAALWLATAGEGGSDAVPLSLLLVLLLPLFLQGLGALHVRSRSLRGRTAMLVLLYALLLLFSVPAALLVTALGLVEHWGRRAPAPPPPHS
jgi:hypothetical protein